MIKSHIFSCGKEEAAFLTNSSRSIQPLQWEGLPIGGLDGFMHSVYSGLAGHRVFICADSVGEQLFVELFLYFRSVGRQFEVFASI